MKGAMNGAQQPVLTRPAARREAAKVLGIALQTRYRKFLESSGDENATVVATADLAQCMYENVEFIIWALKSVGGLNPPPPHALTKVSASAAALNDKMFAKPPEPVLAEPVADVCTCPPMDKELIGANRHMTSCPKFVP
jgi:hypothetical protein